MVSILCAAMAPPAPDPSLLSIHNEVLCFIANKVNTVPFEALIKICADFYASEKIHSAKETLWESVISPSFPGRTDMRLIKRKNAANSKERADMEDILKALQVCDKEGISMPQFYALDLGNIPPVTPEQVDMGVLMGQFHMMQQELCQLKEAIQTLTVAPKITTPPKSWAQVAVAPPQSDPTPGQASTVASPPPQRTESGPVAPPQHKQGEVGAARQSQPQNPTTKLAQITCPADSDGFITVRKTRKGKRQKEVKGTGTSQNLVGVAAPPRTAQLFVGRLDASTTSEAVVLHTNMLLGESGKAKVEEIPHCAAKYGYKGFRVQVPMDSVSLVMQADKWPAHVSVKKYYAPRLGKGGVKRGPLSRSTSVENL